jgi:DnaJ like chaperone protein
MGIFRRIVRIIQAELSFHSDDRDHHVYEQTVDDELRQIIDELRSQRHAESAPRATGVVEWAYRTLGVPPTATNEQIKTAYRRAMRHVHPDRYAHAPQQEQLTAAERARQINRAYAILKAVRNF